MRGRGVCLNDTQLDFAVSAIIGNIFSTIFTFFFALVFVFLG
ncbi:hypothetical protein RchiOBHm_Chr5g0043181 [Rosa chinensis]|uniref:Uncharacterized protein n=1 Tax=Rosa chinensis TaxID=74649 RepID=A0A2P6QD95_ROSCH|nr:hypothetical protein RchiOBHm_Chr5g0043181 [Rosa chinensis]